jgi:hypothetical protein
VIVDDESGPVLESISRVIFDERGRHHGYVGCRGDEMRAYRDHRPGPAFEEVTDLRLTEDHWGYLGHREGRTSLMIDGEQIARYAWAGDLALTPSGEPLVLVRTDDGGMAVHRSGRRYAFDFVVEGTLVLGRGGRHWACVAGDRRGRELFISLDGRRRRPLSSDELGAALVASPPALLRRRVAAELARAKER